jgi:hypothetical protein
MCATGSVARDKTAVTAVGLISSEDGLRLIKAFMRIPRPAMRHQIVNVVEELAGRKGERDAA